MATIQDRQSNPSHGVDYSELNIPDDQCMGTGVFTTTLQPDIMARDFPVMSWATIPPTFQITLTTNPLERKVAILLGRANNTLPISWEAFGIPENFESSKNCVFRVVFADWEIQQLTMNEHELPAIPRSESQVAPIPIVVQTQNQDSPPIWIDPMYRGYLTPLDLLRSNCHFHFWIPWPNQGIAFRVANDEYLLELRAQESQLVFCRNEFVVSIAVNELIGEARKLFVTIDWTPTSIRLGCGAGMGGSDELHSEIAHTPPVLPPDSLVALARKSGLLPTYEYESEEAFRGRVHTALNSIQEKIDQMSNISGFYDLLRAGNAIKDRKPKREIDVKPFIRGFLDDQMLLAGIEVDEETDTGAGTLDLKFTGFVKGRGPCSLLAEFKNAHSDRIESGLTEQLPVHLQSKRATYSAYCILWYKGEWCQEPKDKDTPDELLLALELNRVDACASEPRLQNVRLFVFDLSKKPSASRR